MKKHLAGIIAFLGVILVSLGSASAENNEINGIDGVIKKATEPQLKWDGPTTGPRLQSGKSVVFVASDLQNGGVCGVLDGFQEAAQDVRWRVQVLDGKGTAKGQLEALDSALAKKPDAVIIGGWNPYIAKDKLLKAQADGVKLVAWHGIAHPGPIPECGVFFNIATDSDDVAMVAALYAISKSKGKAKAVIFTDSTYQIALDKANAMKKTLTEFPQSNVLEFLDIAIADAEKRMPAVTEDLLKRYGNDFQFALAINDIYFDFMAPALKAAGKKGNDTPFNISAGDGSITAYQRIRRGDHQIATIPEPLLLHGWQALDECNRAMTGEAPSGYTAAVHLVTQDNIAFDGGPVDIYEPQNNYREEYKRIWGVR